MSKNIFNISDDRRGSIAFFSSYRPPIPLDIYSSPISPSSKKDEFLMTDGQFYNHTGQEIPSEALKTMLKHTQLGLLATPEDVDNGDVSGFMLVSERLIDKLETLHVALSFNKAPTTPRSVLNNRVGGNNALPGSQDMLQEITNQIRKMQVSKLQVAILPLAKLYSQAFDGVRMEDSACFAGDRYLIFISTMQAAPKLRQPWTCIYKMDLTNGQTIRLTPRGVADFSPSVSPSGEMIAIATLEHKSGGWTGEIEDLETDIVLMNVKPPYNRRLVIKDGGWPSWGSNNILYFHRKSKDAVKKWGVFRADLSRTSSIPIRVTPENVDAMTLAAIDENRVAVAVIRDRLGLGQPRKSPDNYRHIEVFDFSSPQSSAQVTRMMNPYTDHHNPFVILEDIEEDDDDDEDDVLIGYHRSKDINNQREFQISDALTTFDKIELEDPPNVGLYRIPGVYPTFSADGTKLAFVDNDFQNVYLADIQGGLRSIFNVSKDMPQLPPDERSVFSPVWNKDQKKDTLYICVGPAFSAYKPLRIHAIYNASSDSKRFIRQITDNDGSNNAFPIYR